MKIIKKLFFSQAEIEKRFAIISRKYEKFLEFEF